MSEHSQREDDQKPQQNNADDAELQSDDLEGVSGGSGLDSGAEDIEFNWNCKC